MKRLHLFPAAILALAFSACESGQTIDSGGFDPLVAPGSGRRGPDVVDAGLRPGQFVRTSMDNVAFFKKRPSGNADADKLLTANTEMKVISDDGSYVKVELNSGEVGYVPSVLVADRSAPQDVPASVPSGNEFQVYPPVPGATVPTDPNVPDIPPVIDPEAPIAPPELPPSTVEDVPLPPNGEDVPLPPNGTDDPPVEVER